MVVRKPITKVIGSPNKLQEMPTGDTIDPVSAGLAVAFAGTTDTQTLTNKTLTGPKIAAIADANGVTAIAVTTTASAVNQVTVTPSATGQPARISATGTDASIVLDLASKGSAGVTVDGSTILTATGTATLTNKTHTDPRISTNLTTHNCAVSAVTPGGAICDDAGNPVLAILDPASSGATYLGVRNQNDIAFASPSIVACSPTQADVHVLLQGKGAGVVRVRVSAGLNATVLHDLSVINPSDYRPLSNPTSAAATAVGLIPFGGRIPCGLASASVAVTNNILYWFPFFAPRNGAASVSVTGVTLSTGAANAVASNVKVGIYTNQGSTATWPADSGTSLVTGSEVILALPGAASTAVLSPAMTASLTPGAPYWLALCFETNACITRCWHEETPTLPIMGCYSDVASALGFFNATTTRSYTGWKAAFTYAALPANSQDAAVADLFQFTNINAAGTPNIMGLLSFGS